MPNMTVNDVLEMMRREREASAVPAQGMTVNDVRKMLGASEPKPWRQVSASPSVLSEPAAEPEPEPEPEKRPTTRKRM